METLRITKPSPHVAVVTLCRPAKLNSMNLKFFDEIREAFAVLQRDVDVRAVVLCGEGRAFTAGLDCKT
jgi:enoyl-CoA hydratase/carnithine racemase